MSTEQAPPDVPPSPPSEQDITTEERDALLRDTLKGLEEAFAVINDGDDAETATELHQDPTEAPPTQSEDSQ